MHRTLFIPALFVVCDYMGPQFLQIIIEQWSLTVVKVAIPEAKQNLGRI